MDYFDCNAAGTTGYSVATDGMGIVKIHAHRQGHDSVHLYKDTLDDLASNSLFWIYMPLDQGEYLTEICQHRGFRLFNRDAIRLVVRNRKPCDAVHGR